MQLASNTLKTLEPPSGPALTFLETVTISSPATLQSSWIMPFQNPEPLQLLRCLCSLNACYLGGSQQGGRSQLNTGILSHPRLTRSFRLTSDLPTSATFTHRRNGAIPLGVSLVTLTLSTLILKSVHVKCGRSSKYPVDMLCWQVDSWFNRSSLQPISWRLRKTQHWIDTYAGTILPEAAEGEEPIPPAIADVTIYPPKTRRPSGRPKDKRIPFTGEVQVPWLQFFIFITSLFIQLVLTHLNLNFSQPPKKTKLIPNKFGRCGSTGHNRTRCVVPIWLWWILYPRAPSFE